MAQVGEDALKVFVGGLPKGTTPEVLTTWGSQFGLVTRAECKLDLQGQPRGFGFIYYSDPSGALAVLANKDNNMMDGKWIDCKAVLPSASAHANKGDGKGNYNDPTNPKLFVGGLPRNATQESLTAHFSQFGAVSEVEVRLHQDGSCQGFAFVLFADAASAKLVQDNHANNQFEGKWIDCKSAVQKPKGGGRVHTPVVPPVDKGYGKGKAGGGAYVADGGAGYIGGNSFGAPPMGGFGGCFGAPQVVAPPQQSFGDGCGYGCVGNGGCGGCDGGVGYAQGGCGGCFDGGGCAGYGAIQNAPSKGYDTSGGKGYNSAPPPPAYGNGPYQMW